MYKFLFFVVLTKNIMPKGIQEVAEHAAGGAQCTTLIPESKFAVIMMYAIQTSCNGKKSDCYN